MAGVILSDLVGNQTLFCSTLVENSTLFTGLALSYQLHSHGLTRSIILPFYCHGLLCRIHHILFLIWSYFQHKIFKVELCSVSFPMSHEDNMVV